jgi:uncharacterized protein YcbX
MNVTVASLHSYPIKSAGAVDLTQATIGARGFPFDRHWMLIDCENCFVSQRQLPLMARFSVEIEGDHLNVSWPGKAPCTVSFATPTGAAFQATMHGSQRPFLVVDEGLTASQWFTDCIGERKGQALRLVRLAPDFVRHVPDDLGERAAAIHLADAYPYLVTSTASLRGVAENLEAGGPALAMNRFRPNIVLEMAEPWAEMEGGTLRDESGVIALELLKPCKRCGTPQVNQETGKLDIGSALHDALTNLSGRLPVVDNFFGQNAVVDRGVGELLEIGQHLVIERR